MASAKLLFQERTFAIITGASKGLGRCIAIQFSAEFSSGSVIVITARNKEGLKETAQLAIDERRARKSSGDVEIICVVSDLSNTEDIQNLVKSSVQNHQNSSFTSAMLVLNFGTIGDISKEVCDFRDPDEISDYFKVNVAHIPVISGNFVDWATSGNRKVDTVIINVSSLGAIEPLLCFGLYSAGKAARDMMLKVLATENPSIRVLNWAPGPLGDTDMTKLVWSTSNRHNTDVTCRKRRDEGQYLTCKQSTAKLIHLLRNDSYKSGQHVDYYDVSD